MAPVDQDDAEKSPPWLTIVMPVHNGADYLEATLKSLIGEADRDVEIILIDSSDDDSCREIAERFQKDLDLNYSHRPDLKPWPAKTNEAVLRARADHVAMLHQDDLWLSGRAAAMRGAIDRHPDVAMFLAPSHFIDNRGRKVGLWRCPLKQRERWGGQEVLERLLIQNFIAIPAPVIRKDCWIACGGMDEALWYTADWDLYLKLCGQGDIVYLREATTAFRIHPKSLTVTGSRNAEDFRRQLTVVVERHASKLTPDCAADVVKIANASVQINAGMAEAANGNFRKIIGIIREICFLNVKQAMKYISYSRIFERIPPRIIIMYLVKK